MFSEAHYQLIPPEIPLNSKKCLWLCFPWRPCKRMKECLNCQETRREFFLSQGEAYIKKHALDTFVTISFTEFSGEAAWPLLARLIPDFSKGLSARKLGPFVRTLGVGERRCPHLHYIVTSSGAEKIYALAHSKSFKRRARANVNRKPVYNPVGLLEYFYDDNFFPAFLDPERPRGIRILSASRGMPCGFPARRPRREAHVASEIGQAQIITLGNKKSPGALGGPGKKLAWKERDMKVAVE